MKEILLRIYIQAKSIMDNKVLGWEEKYSLIFSDSISVKVSSMITLNYYDPDTTYEEDVRAWFSAFEEYLTRFDII